MRRDFLMRPLHLFFGFLALGAGWGGCGPVDLAGNVQHAGPIDGPFAVSDYFSQSGFMGDGMLSGFLTASTNEECKARPPKAEGNCYRFSYELGSEKWAGSYFQYPANNWGSQPGRKIEATFQDVSFFIAAEYSVTLPKGQGIGASCTALADCRPGLDCDAGSCQPARSQPLGEHCLVSGECEGEAQCLAQTCVPAGAGAAGEACAQGSDAACVAGLHCGVENDSYQCLAEGAGDVGAACSTRNDCRAGLYCRDDQCAPKTILGPFNFQVGGIAPTKPGLEYSDPIGVSYFASGDQPQPLVGPDWQQFTIDLGSTGAFDSLIGAFMWAVPFPQIDVMTEPSDYPYLADRSQPVVIYLDSVVFR